MYTLVSAIGKSRTGAKRWEAVSIGDVPVNQIYDLYSKTWAELSNPLFAENVALDLDLIRDEFGGRSFTFNELLASLDNRSLPTQDAMPELKPKFARWNQGFRADYTIQPVSPNHSPSTDVPDEDRTWLLMTNTRRKVDYEKFYESCMVSICGYYHRIEGNEQGIWVHDGMKTGRKAEANDIGIWSFADVGKLRYVPITPDMVYAPGEGQKLRYRMNIDFGVDLSKSSLILVLGGYAHVLDSKVFSRISDTAITVDTQNMPLLDRYFESRNQLDFSSFGLETPPINESQVALSQLFSDEAMLAWATLSQSFLVMLDNTDIFVDYGSIQPTKIPGQYVSHTYPEWPMVTGHGRVEEYWAIEERVDRQTKRWGLNVKRSATDRRIYNTTDINTLSTVSDQRVPVYPTKRANAFFLKVGTDM